MGISRAALEILLQARDEASRIVAGAADSFSSLGKSVGQVAQDLRPVGELLAGVGAAGAVAIGKATSQAIDFNAQVALMNIAAGDAAGGLDVLHDAAIAVGGDTRLVGVSASGAADSISELYRAGLDTTDIFGDLNAYMSENAELGGVLRASIDLAAASELDMAMGAELLSVQMATFGRDASEASAITDNFVQAADASVASVSELAEAMVNVGPTAASFGWELEDVNTGLAILSQRGIKGAEAGTSLKSMMTNLMRPTDEVTGALNELNVSLYDSQGVMYSLPEIIEQLSGAMQGLTQEQRNQYVQTLAGTYGMKAMNTLLSEGVDGWEEMEIAIANAATAQEIATAKAETLAGQIEAFEGSLETAQITLGERFTPRLAQAVGTGTEMLEWFNNLSPAAQGATADVLGLTTVVAGLGGGLILLTPRIVSTIEAFGTLAPMAQNVKAGLDLMKAGFSGAEVASTGLAGSTAALLSALGPLALGAAAIAAISHDYGVVLYDTRAEVEAATQSYDEYAAAMAVAGMEMEAMSQSQYALLSWTDGQKQALDDLTQGYYADIAAMGEAQGAMGPLGGAFGEVGSAASGAAGAVDGLNEAIASITVGDKVQELDLGAQAAYDMAASMGVADEALVELGVQLGLFSQAEADATRAIQVAAAEFAATGDVEAYRNAVADVTLALAADKQAAAEATGAIQYLTGGMVEGTNAAGPAASGLHNVAGGAQDAGGAFSRAAAEARHAAAAIRSIPTSWSVHVHTRYTESGVPPTATDTSGGASEYQHGTWYVPETGWAYLHQAEMVIPAQAAQGLRDMMGGGGGGGGIAMGGAGGGIVVQNYFGRDSVRSNADIEEIARQIEESLVLRGVRTFEV